MAPKIKLTYFDIEGAAEPVRLALLLTETEFEDARVSFPEWPALKPTTPYGQVPTMTIDDGPVMTQSKAMLRFVGSKYSDALYPLDKLYDIEQAIGLVEDLFWAWRTAMFPQKEGFADGFYDTDEGKILIKSLREKFMAETFPKFMGFISGLLEKNGGKWLASTEGPTIADCYAVPFIRGLTTGHMDHIPPSCLESYPVVLGWVKSFCALPAVKGRYTKGVF